MSTYRLARGPALMGSGLFVVIGAVTVFVASVLVSGPTWSRVVGSVFAVLSALALVQAARFMLRPPVIARLTPQGFLVRRPRRRARWEDVENVSVDEVVLTLRGETTEAALTLSLVEPAERQALVRDVYDRLNTANGYTRFS